MNARLEALLQTYDAWRNASGAEVQRQKELFFSRLADEVERCKLSEATLLLMVRRRHRTWLKAQNRPTTLPPKA
jgi:hypothetical protein